MIVDLKELGKKLMEVAYLEGDFVLRSGKRSKYYFDKYLFETRPEVLGPVAEELAKRLPQGTRKLAGPELGAVPLAAAIALKTGLPYVIVRKGAKGYGTSKAVEGQLAAGESVVMIEDVLTTGGAALEAAEALKAMGVKVEKILAVLDREEGAADNFAKVGIPYEALFSKTSLGI